MERITKQREDDEAAKKRAKEDEELRLKIEKCLQCQVDREKTVYPRDVKVLQLFTVEKPGKIHMRNGETYDYYWDKEKNIPRVRDILFIDYKYEKMEDMEKEFLKKCVEKYCPGLSL